MNFVSLNIALIIPSSGFEDFPQFFAPTIKEKSIVFKLSGLSGISER